MCSSDLPAGGGTVSNSTVSITFPPGAASEGGNFQATLSPFDLDTQDIPATLFAGSRGYTMPSGFMLGTLAFQVTTTTADGRALTAFGQPVTVRLTAPAEDLRRAGGDVNRIVVMRFNSGSRSWVDVPTRPDLLGAVNASISGPGVFAVAVQVPVPGITGPNNSDASGGLAPKLQWTVPTGAQWYHLQVIPFNQDGPGIDLLVGDPDQVAAGSYQVAAPRIGGGNYVLLPGMSYVWRIRSSPSTAAVGITDPVWSDWASGSFRTPAPSSRGITATAPAEGSAVANLTPALTWNNSDTTA